MCVVNCCSLRFLTKDMTITIVIINPQTEERVLRIWGFSKRVSWSWELTMELGVWESAIESKGWLFRISTGRDKLRSLTARWDGVSMSKNRCQKLINAFVPETTEFACFCICVLYLYLYMYPYGYTTVLFVSPPYGTNDSV